MIEHYRRTQPGGTIAAITGELDLLRIAVQTLATVVRITTPQVRQLARGGLLHSAITPPKSRLAGYGGDNAAMESFLALLPKNVLNRFRWRTREERCRAIVTWIEKTHHRRRRQDRPDRPAAIE